MVSLLIDTSTEKSLIAFVDESGVILDFLLPGDVPSSHNLMTLLERGFQSLKIRPAQLSSICVGIGPGSYTGIRVGVAAAKGLSFPHNTPLIGLCSLEGFISHEEGVFASVIDARSAGSYIWIRQKLGEKILSLTEPMLIAKKEVLEYLATIPTHIGPHNCYPDPLYLSKVAIEKFKRGELSRDLAVCYLNSPSYAKNC